jgi:hypothetical protein
MNQKSEIRNQKSEIRNQVEFEGKSIDLMAARMLMDDDLCEKLHLTVDSEQEFFDAYLAAHLKKYGVDFVFN